MLEYGWIYFPLAQHTIYQSSIMRLIDATSQLVLSTTQQNLSLGSYIFFKLLLLLPTMVKILVLNFTIFDLDSDRNHLNGSLVLVCVKPHCLIRQGKAGKAFRSSKDTASELGHSLTELPGA